MALISKNFTFSAGATIVASEHNSNFDTIYNEFNGSISNANIDSSANIALSKIDKSGNATFGGDNTYNGTSDFNDSITCRKITHDANFGTHFTEGTAPSTAASEGALYTKDTSGQPELFYREESDGDEVQITSGGQVGTTTSASSFVSKAWVYITWSGGTPSVQDSYNYDSVAGLTDNGTGDVTIPWDTDFSSANYVCVATPGDSSNSGTAYVKAQAAGTTRIQITNVSGAAYDPDIGLSVVCYGTQ